MALRKPPPLRYRKNEQAPNLEKMSRLAERFRSLRGKPGVRPWVPGRLDEHGQGPGVTPRDLHAIRFVLHVWNHSTRWRSGAFNLGLALSAWSDRERDVFSQWAGDPWLG